MKKILSTIITFALTLPLICIPASAGTFLDVPANASYAVSVDRLSQYGVISGYEGLFSPGDTLTRAEFAKISAIVGGLNSQAAASMGNKKFPDVDVTHWSNGYVNAVAAAGIIYGFPEDGTFRPDKSVDFAEAVTIVLRLLDYNTKDLGDNWPFAYTSKAREMGLTVGIEQDSFTPISRANTAILIDRALEEFLNGTTRKLSTKLDFTETLEVTVTSTNKQDPSLLINQIQVSNGAQTQMYECLIPTDTFPLLAKVKLLLNKDGKVVSFTRAETSFSEPAVLRTAASLDYFRQLGFPADANTSFVRDGYAVGMGELNIYDVVYYSASTNSIYAYSTKRSGVYEKALPDKVNVRSIRLSGVTYELETVTAMDKLGEGSGSYRINAAFTALLGMDGRIVDAVDLNSAAAAAYGVMLSSELRVSDDPDSAGRAEWYATVMTGTGVTASYKAEQEYKIYVGTVVAIKFDDSGFFKPGGTTALSAKVSGVIDAANNKIGGNTLTADAKIIEVFNPAHSSASTASVVELKDIPLTELSADNVVFALADNKFGDISFLVVRNISKTQYDYGVLVSSQSGRYTVIMNGERKTYSANFSSNLYPGMAVAVLANGGSAQELFAIPQITTSGKLDAIDFTRVNFGGKTYRLAPDVQVYQQKGYDSTGQMGYNYLSVSMSEIDDYSMTNVRMYADKSPDSGGLVRVIIFN